MGPMIVAAGAFAPLSLLSVSAIMLCIAIGFAQLSRVAPNAGSSYSWIRMAFGAYAGAYGAWLLILSNVFATLATGLGFLALTLVVWFRLAREGRLRRWTFTSPWSPGRP